MCLTREEETRIIISYDPLIRRTAVEYYRKLRPRNHRIEFDDIYQSARLGFLHYLRDSSCTVDRGEFTMPKVLDSLYMKHYIGRYVKTCSPVHIPERVVRRGSADILELDIEEVESDENVLGAYGIEDEVADRLDMEVFLADLKEEERRVLTRLLNGETWKDVREQEQMADYNNVRRIRKNLQAQHVRHTRRRGTGANVRERSGERTAYSAS